MVTRADLEKLKKVCGVRVYLPARPCEFRNLTGYVLQLVTGVARYHTQLESVNNAQRMRVRE